MRLTIFLLIVLTTLQSFGQIDTLNSDRERFFPKEELSPTVIPGKSSVWVFIMAGQSNMAGRALVEPQDTVPNVRILTLNKDGKLVVAKEPLHFYTKGWSGLDCGMSFARELLKSVPDTLSVLLVPTAVGGSPISNWINDMPHRGVHLYSNFKERLAIAEQYGEVKAILWHQGESDANPDGIRNRYENLEMLFSSFRKDVGNVTLPILVGQIGSYSKHPKEWKAINDINRKYARKDKSVVIIETSDLKDKGDKLHFDSPGQREMGRRFAEVYARYLQETNSK
ncbi:MAG: sialate O-acetylesterase [Mangrovibacterium sp.]